MQGIQSLMQAPQGQQGPMPGQAPMQPMQGMMPQQGAPTPGAMTGSLKNMPLDQLKMLYMNPQAGSPPLWAVISALAEKQKEAQAMQAAQGQQAMAQNAQMQQQPPVAAQVLQSAEQMSPPQQRANPEQQLRQRLQSAMNSGNIAEASAIMDRLKEFEQEEFTKQEAPPGYAGGGAVSFRHGGDVQKFSLGADEFGVLANPEAEAMDALRVERAQKERQAKVLEDTYYSLMMQGDPRAAQVKQQLDAIYGRVPVTPSAVASGPTRQGKSGIADLDVGPSMAPVQRTGVPAPAPSPAGPRMQTAAPAPAPTPSSGISPEMEAYFRNRASELRTRQGIPEDVASGRAGLEALARENIAAQRGEAETFGREARERRDAVLARSQRGILDDPQALLALAGSIDTRKGQGIGSLARGAAGLLSQREAAAEAAKEKYATAQQTERALQANVRQSTMLEAQRAQALREGDFNRANQIKDQIDALMMQRETLLMERRDKAIEQSRLERGLDIQERGARAQERAAGRPNELELAMSRPEDYKRILAARAEAQQLRRSSEEVRAAAMERYADNWEKLDMLQKGDLAKQGITNFQQYVRMRDQMAGVGGASSGGKTMTMADIQATASSSGKTPEEVRKAAIAAGYTIQ
jgi:hypothetical protein